MKKYEKIFETSEMPNDPTFTKFNIAVVIFSITAGPALITFTLWASIYKHEISLWFGKLFFL